MIIGKFVVNGTNYVVVKMENATHVMPEAEWGDMYVQLYSDRWNGK